MAHISIQVPSCRKPVPASRLSSTLPNNNSPRRLGNGIRLFSDPQVDPARIPKKVSSCSHILCSSRRSPNMDETDKYLPQWTSRRTIQQPGIDTLWMEYVPAWQLSHPCPYPKVVGANCTTLCRLLFIQILDSCRWRMGLGQEFNAGNASPGPFPGYRKR